MNLWNLYHELEHHTYQLSGYYYFRVYDPKVREIQALTLRDRVVQHSLCDNVLRPYFEPRLIYDSAACREGKGTRFATDRLTSFLRKYYKKNGAEGYILKFDIRKFFDSIDHIILKQKLVALPDENIKELLWHIIDSFQKNDKAEERARGIPLGNQTSQWFALWYLNDLDRLIKEKLHIKYYSRYMDDGILIHESKEYLQECFAQMKTYVEEKLRLEFNEKTQIFPICQGADYLGFRFYLTESGKVIRRLRTSNKKRWKRRMKLYQKQYSMGQKSLEDITKSIKSYHGHLQYGNTYRLRKNVYGKFILTRSKNVNEEDSESEKENSNENHELSAHHSNDSRRTQPVTAYNSGGNGR